MSANSLSFTGKVKFIGVVEQVTESFRKRVLVLESDEQYPQTAPFEFTQDRTGKLDFVKVGEVVTVHFNIRGNEYNGRWFTALQAWKMDKVEANNTQGPPAPLDPLAAPAAQPAAPVTETKKAEPAPAAQPAAQPAANSEPAAGSIDDIDDDLPF